MHVPGARIAGVFGQRTLLRGAARVIILSRISSI
jgi:hypothetical protein